MESVHSTDIVEGGNSSLGTAFVKCQTMSDGLSNAGFLLFCMVSEDIID